MTAPQPNVAESESCAMLPTLATISMPSAGHARFPTLPAFTPSGGAPVAWVTGVLLMLRAHFSGG